MAYTINFTDSVNKGNIVVEDQTLNTDTSLTLVGRNKTGFGESVNTNFLHLLENFANTTAPSNPVEGQLWYDTTTNIDQLKIYDGTNWVSAGGLKRSATAPDAGNSVQGDLWSDTSNQQLYMYSGTSWILVGPEFSTGVNTGAKPLSIVDTTDATRNVVAIYITDIPVAIFAKEAFTPKIAIAGFTTLSIGVNLSSTLTAKFNGTAEKAENLMVSGNPIPGTSFLRTDQNAVLEYPLTVKTDTGISVGQTNTLDISVEGTNSILHHLQTDSNFDIRVNNNGTNLTPIRLTSDGKIGLFNLSPSEALEVTGNAKLNGTVNITDTTQSSTASNGSLKTAGGLGVAKNLNVGENLSVTGTTTFSGNVLPNTTNTYNLGSSGLKFNNVYANTFTGAFVGSVTGNVSGSSSTASKLSSATNFSLAGDITSDTITYDGITGGTTKTFTTALNPTFVETKTLVSSLTSADEFLINRPGTGLRKVTQPSIISNVATVQVGTLNMWAGPSTTVPTGWFVCDGSEKSLTTYAVLATALGYDPSDNSTWYWGTPSDETLFFVIPDMRGRLPAGIRSGATGTRIVNDTAINTLGNVGGSETRTISQANLPDHEHDLKNANNQQFYAISKADHSADSDTDVYTQNLTASQGSGITSSGSMKNVSNTAMQIVPPFSTMNFIIYHGVV